MVRDGAYAFPNLLGLQSERLRALEELLDAGTIHQLEARGVRRGWRCLEVGAGAGSIASWLAIRVGSEGAVVATDLDTTHLRDLSKTKPQGLRRKHTRWDDGVLGSHAVAIERRECIYLVTRPDDNARKLIGRHRRQSIDRPFQLVTCNRCRMHAHQRVARPGDGVSVSSTFKPSSCSRTASTPLSSPC